VRFFDFICQRSSTTPIPAHLFYIGRVVVKTEPALSGQPLVFDGRLGAFRKAGSRSQTILPATSCRSFEIVACVRQPRAVDGEKG
jgi:hypothetical protein